MRSESAAGMPSRRRLVILLIGLLGAAVGLFLQATGATDRLEATTVDARFGLRGAEQPPEDLIIVGIDDDTFSALNVQFPFPRSYHAEVIDNLVEDGAEVIAYDVQFTEPTKPQEDNALIRSVWSAPKITLATTEVRKDGAHRILGGPEILEGGSQNKGNDGRGADAQILLGEGGVLRQVPPGDTGLELFPVAVAEQRDGGQIDVASFPEEPWVDYFGPPGTIPEISFSDVKKGKFEPGTFEGKTVFVGATSSVLQDTHKVPTDTNEMPGVEYQATATDTIARDFPLRSSSSALDLVVILALGLIPVALFVRFDPLLSFLVTVGAGFAYVVIAQIGFNAGMILPIVYPLAALTVSGVGGLGASYIFEAFDRQRARDTFARFVSDAVVDQVLDDRSGTLLKGRRTEVTVLFSDIRGFTTFSETRSPEDVFEILNHYLTEMAEAILEEGGTIMSFMGDGILAVFGTPLESDDHADRAIAAAQKMLGPRLEAFNEWVGDQGVEPFQMGVGIHSGPVMSGMIGSERRLDYTAIGDTTNTSARLEGMTKGTPHQLFVSESTKIRLVDSAMMATLVKVGDLDVRGREGSISVWTIAGLDKPAEDS